MIIIDEIQKIPELLDPIHRLIENKKIIFLLTGSSARKLKRSGVNLLAGRARLQYFFPLTSFEIPDFNLLKYINIGGLPAIYTSKNPYRDLESYIQLYLKEEILNEALTRNVRVFHEFLSCIALSSGEEISYQSMASDLGVSPNTIKNYIEILEDTLVAYTLNAFTKTKKRKAITRGKLFFFDVGISNYLAKKKNLEQGSTEFGKSFEQFLITEIRSYLHYRHLNFSLNYWRSTSSFEVDLIINEKIALEIKTTTRINDNHLKGLRALKEENLLTQFLLVSFEEYKRITQDNIIIYPWREFLKDLWEDKILPLGQSKYIWE